jgi:hypothetical protein
MSESQTGNPTRCPTVYCLNSDSVLYDVELQVADTEDGVWLSGDSRIPFGARVKITSSATQTRTVRVVGTEYKAVVPAEGEAIIALTDAEVDPWLGEIGGHELELVEEPETAPFSVTVFHPGAFDMNQSAVSEAVHGGGCCRTSIALTATHLFSGFLGHGGAFGKRYMTRTVTTEYYPFVSGGCSVTFAGANELSPFSFNGARIRIRQRFRSRQYMIRARDEVIVEQENGGVYSLDDSGYVRFFGEYAGRIEAWEDFPGDEICANTQGYFIAAGITKTISDTLKTTQLLWKRGQLDNEGVIQEPFLDAGIAGLITIELDDEYTIQEALSYIDAAFDTGQRWLNVEYPHTKAELSFFEFDDSSAAVSLNGCRLDNGADNQTEIFDASGPTWTSDWLFGQGADLVWPPATGATWCDELENCAGLINSPTPPDYRCVLTDDGNSLNGLLPANANTEPAPAAGITLSARMFTLDHPSNPLRNPCATKQNLAAGLSNDPEDADPDALSVISPPLHHLAEITFTAYDYGILIKRTAVKHWWGAPYCRAVYELRESDVTLVDCEQDLDGIRYDSTAPCAWIDDPARQVGRIQPTDEAGLTAYDPDVVGWANEIQPGQVFSRVVEMTCPNLETPENPCGCG